jgi:hypothetical protein
MNSISVEAFEHALALHRLSAGSDARSTAHLNARARFNELVWNVGRRLLDLLRVSTSARLLQPEHLHNLSKVAQLLQQPLPMCARTNKAKKAATAKQSGGHAGTVMTGSFFDAANANDASAYTAAYNGSPVFAAGAAPGDGLIRYALPASPVFPVAQGGGGGGGSGATNSWLTNDALSSLFREYKARGGNDLRVSEAARALIRRSLEANVNAVLKEAAKGKESRRITADGIARAACKVAADGMCLSF